MPGTVKPLKNRNIQDSIAFFLSGGALIWYSLKKHYGGPSVEWKMSPYLFPILVSVFLMLLSVSLFFDGLYQLRHGEEKKTGPVKFRSVLITIGLSAAYVVLMGWIGFIPATIIFLAVFTFFLGERRLWLIALLALAAALSIYGIFGMALGVMLP
jgi:hypothetical protein